MTNDLSIVIGHYYSSDSKELNPLFETIQKINKQKNKYNIEVIIADDGSEYSKNIIENYSKKIEINNDPRDIYILEKEKLESFLISNNFKNSVITKWVYLPKIIPCMSKARVANYAVKESNSDKLLFLDDDNHFISENSIENLFKLFKKYDIIIGQIKDNNGRLREFTSSRVQGTTIALSKSIFSAINGFGEWTEKFSCGIDSDFWIKMYQYYVNHKIKVCYTDMLKTYDSFSKRWGKFTTIFRNYKIRKEFYKIYNCKNYKNKKYNLARNKSLWIENLIEN